MNSLQLPLLPGIRSRFVDNTNGLNMHILEAGFTEANECITPTFKLRRPFLLRRYVKELMDMYDANGEPNRADEHWAGVD